MSNTLTLQQARFRLTEVYRTLCIARNAALHDLRSYDKNYDHQEIGILNAFVAVGISLGTADDIFKSVNESTYTRSVMKNGQVVYSVVN